MRETSQQKKEQLVVKLVDVRQKILDRASSLPEERRKIVFLGEWDVYDVLAHLAGWDYTNFEAIAQIQSENLPEFYQSYSRDWQIYNAQLVAKYRLDDLEALIQSVKFAQQELINCIMALPAEELYRDRGIRFKGYKVTIARLLEAELKDERVHLAQLEKFAAN